MMKATLTTGQVGAAVVAGLLGHLLFAIGWTALGITLLGGIVAALLGGSLASLGQLFSSEGVAGVFDSAGGVLGSVVLGLLIASVVLIVIGFVVSGLILRSGKARRPWGTTVTAIVIAAIIDVPLVAVYAGIARATDGIPFLVIALLGTLVVGVLVWLWMTWAHRGPAVGTAAPVVTAPADGVTRT